jgi:hypothetical protein
MQVRAHSKVIEQLVTEREEGFTNVISRERHLLEK